MQVPKGSQQKSWQQKETKTKEAGRGNSRNKEVQKLKEYKPKKHWDTDRNKRNMRNTGDTTGNRTNKLAKREGKKQTQIHKRGKTNKKTSETNRAIGKEKPQRHEVEGRKCHVTKEPIY